MIKDGNIEARKKKYYVVIRPIRGRKTVLLIVTVLRPRHLRREPRDVCGKRAIRPRRSRTTCTCGRAAWIRRAASTRARTVGTPRRRSTSATRPSDSAAAPVLPRLKKKIKMNHGPNRKKRFWASSSTAGVHFAKSLCIVEVFFVFCKT